MRNYKGFILFAMLVSVLDLPAQTPISRKTFFEESGLLKMALSTDLKKLVTTKKLDTYQPATVTIYFPDSTSITEEIKLTARGEFRRNNCYMPTMKLDFKNSDTLVSQKLGKLKKLKLVCGCSTGEQDERLVLKEFLIYKMYNLLTDLSFRVRLLEIKYSDSKGKMKSFTQHGFFIEDVDDMAKRNKCKEVQEQAFHAEKTNRSQMNLVDIFQYMIGNTDWSVPAYHNIKLMVSKADTLSPPYTIPYDFDFAGLVNASYATPHESLGITSVKERLYRGFPRDMAEVEATLNIFREKKEAIRTLVTNFEILDSRSRKDVMRYVDDFYDMIDSKKSVERVFVDGARTN